MTPFAGILCLLLLCTQIVDADEKMLLSCQKYPIATNITSSIFEGM
jgi:hypothetical protein